MDRPNTSLRTIAALTAALLCAPAIALEPDDGLPEGWHVVPDGDLAAMRGGIDFGVLVANFAIERLVRINGEVVARTHLALDGIGDLSNGVVPSVEVLGNLANLIQVGQGNATTSSGSEPPSAAEMTQFAQSMAQGAQAGSSSSSIAASSMNGHSGPGDAAAVVSPNPGAGLGAAGSAGASPVPPVSALPASALPVSAPGSAAAAVAAAAQSAAGAAGRHGAASVAQTAAAAAQAAQAAQQAARAAQAAQAAQAQTAQAAQAAQAGQAAQTAQAGQAAHAAQAAQGARGALAVPASGVSAGLVSGAPPASQAAGPVMNAPITVPIGSTGQTIVVSGIPNAAALATSIQNSVQATRIETLTSINATLSSLAALRSATFAETLRQQAIESIRR